jgi:hypothetical protein
MSSIKEQRLFDSGESDFPIDKGVLATLKVAAAWSKSFGPGLDYLNYNA